MKVTGWLCASVLLLGLLACGGSEADSEQFQPRRRYKTKLRPRSTAERAHQSE